MLWSESHKPTNFLDINHHNHITAFLKTYTLTTIPHLLFYGSSGHSKRTLIGCLINHLYKTEFKPVLKTTTVGKSLQVSYLESKEFIEITPSDYLYQDKNVIQTLIKELSSTKPIVSLLSKEHQNNLKFLVINEADRMSKDAQAALRRTVEKYSSNVRVVLVCEELNAVIEPLRSRSLCIRVNGFEDEDISEIIDNIVQKESKTLGTSIKNEIINVSNGNLRRALCLSEIMCDNRDSSKRIKKEEKLVRLDYQRIIDSIVKEIKFKQDGASVLNIRKELYELLNGCIPANVVLREIVNCILEKATEEVFVKVCECAVMYEERLRLGTKDIIHLEGFVVTLMSVFYKQR